MVKPPFVRAYLDRTVSRAGCIVLFFASVAASCSPASQTIDAGDAAGTGDSGCVAGTFTLVAPVSLPPGTTSSHDVTVTRSSGSCGLVAITYSVNGAGCVAATGQVTFADRASASAPIAVTTTSAGTCTVSLSPPLHGTLGMPSTATIQITTAPASAQFQFAAAATVATVAGAPQTITVTRTNGTEGNWDVPYTLSGPLSAGGTIVAGGGTLSASGTLDFAPSASSVPLTYSPPATVPGGVTLPADLVLTLGTPVPGPAGVPVGQTALLGTQTTHTVTLQSGCPPLPAGLMPTTIPLSGLNILRLNSGQIASAPLPMLMPGQGGEIQNGETSVSPGGATVELAISRCQGVVDNSLGTGCYVRSTFTNYVNMFWVGGPTSGIPDAATANTVGVCWAPSSNGPYYVNIRYTYDSCAYGTCGYAIQWILASI